MDITLMFLAHVKMIRTTNKSLGIVDKKPTSNILSKSKKDANLSKAKEVVKQLTHLRQFLTDNKAAYLNILNHLSTTKIMTEEDRENFESVAEDIVHKCKNIINDYKKEITALKKSEQIEEYYNAVIASLEKYLKEVSKVYTEAKAIRVQRVIEVHNLSKLGPIKRKTEETTDIIKNESAEETSQVKKVMIPEVMNTPNVEEELSAEEMQMFEAENETLYNEMNRMSDEVKQMESKIVHIAELQELFTEKVLQQEGDIDRIADVVVGSTEQIKDANEQIRQAIQRKAGLRAWVLFFLLVMSFSLLFLDWYND